MKILITVAVKVIDISTLDDNKIYQYFEMLKLKYYEDAKDYLKSEHISIKTLKRIIDENSINYEVRSRRYDIINLHDLDQSLNNMIHDINITIDKASFDKSGLVVAGIDNIVIHYSKYNPTRGSSYIELPKWIATETACINIKMMIINVLNMLFNVEFMIFIRQFTLKE